MMPYAGRIAIITRTKNRALLLERAFRSILDQTYRDWFLMVVNDGGDPAPVDQLAEQYQSEFAGRMAVMHNATSLGMEAASNLAIAQSESEYLVVLDDDDSWAPTFLQMCLDELEQVRRVLPGVRGVISHAMLVKEHVDDEGTGIIIDRVEPFNTWVGSGLVSLYRMAQSNVFPTNSFLYRRDALNAIGLYRADLPVLGDWEFNLRFLTRFDVCIVPSALAFYHQRPSGVVSQLGNSVGAGRALHERYDQLLRNEFLRADLQGEGNGLGLLMNTGREMLLLTDQLAADAAVPEQQSGATLARKFARHLRTGGPRRALTVMLRYGLGERSGEGLSKGAQPAAPLDQRQSPHSQKR